MVKKPGEKCGWLLVSPHCASSSWRAPTILTPFSSALTPISSPGPPGRIDSGRFPQWVRLPSTTIRRIPVAGGDRRDRQRPREGGRLGDDRRVGSEARPDACRSSRAGAPSSPRRRPSGAGGRPRAGRPRPRAPARRATWRRPSPSCRWSRFRRAARRGSAAFQGLPFTQLSGSTGGTVSTCPLRISERPPPDPLRTPTRFLRSGSGATQCVSRPACS